MDHSGNISTNNDFTCAHQAECIRLTGRSDVFQAQIVMCRRDGLDLVAPKFAKPGTYLIVRMRKFSPTASSVHEDYIRTTGLTEVRWVEEVIDENGLTFKMRLKYI